MLQRHYWVYLYALYVSILLAGSHWFTVAIIISSYFVFIWISATVPNSIFLVNLGLWIKLRVFSPYVILYEPYKPYVSNIIQNIKHIYKLLKYIYIFFFLNCSISKKEITLLLHMSGITGWKWELFYCSAFRQTTSKVKQNGRIMRTTGGWFVSLYIWQFILTERKLLIRSQAESRRTFVRAHVLRMPEGTNERWCVITWPRSHSNLWLAEALLSSLLISLWFLTPSANHSQESYDFYQPEMIS